MKVASLQTEPIDCLDDWLEQCRKTVRNVFHFIIEWLLAEIIIDISHQVDQTLLVHTIKAVVRGVDSSAWTRFPSAIFSRIARYVASYCWAQRDLIPLTALTRMLKSNRFSRLRPTA